MATYVTKVNDMLDAICVKYYGASHLFTEAVRDVNPHLSDYEALLPANVFIELPDLSVLNIRSDTIRLWD